MSIRSASAVRSPFAVRVIATCVHITVRMRSAATCAAPRSVSGGTCHGFVFGSVLSGVDVRQVARDTLGEDEPLEQRVRGEAVGAMHARARDLAHGVEPRHARVPDEIRHDAAHHVVRGGRDGDEILARVDAARAAEREDARESAS